MRVAKLSRIFEAMSPPSRTTNRSSWPLPADTYALLSRGFDRLAQTYDEDIGANAVSDRMRQIFRSTLLDTFADQSYIFEVGCGTGIDALWLAGRGASIVATDISQSMIDRVKEKAAAAGLTERIQCRKIAAARIGELANEFGEGAFDGGYSHAGALNMEPVISAVPSGLHRLLKAQRRFVCSVINKTSLFELFFYSLLLHPRKAFRRLGNIVPIPLSRNLPLKREVVPARFYSAGDMARIFAGWFELEAARGLQIFLPPSNLTDEYLKAREAFRALEWLEDRVAKTPLFRLCGNHTILVFRRT